MQILRWHYGIPLISSPMIYYYRGGIEWYRSRHLLSFIKYLYFISLSFTTLLMHTDFVAHHNSITTTPCLASHHQMGCPRISTIDWAAWKASIPTIQITRPLNFNWWPCCVFCCLEKTHLFSCFVWTAQPPPPLNVLSQSIIPPPAAHSPPFRWPRIR
jgi:hypothetical protein